MKPPAKARTLPIVFVPELTIGLRVEVTAGLSAGKLGVVVAKWPRTFNGIPQWEIDLGEQQHPRVIRADFLKPVAS